MRKKLLLVDSDTAVQQWVETHLSQEGFEVSSYNDGLSALDRFYKIDPDVIFADYQIAGMNIYRFCDKLRQRSGERTRPLFLMIHSEEGIDKERLRAAGVVDFIQTPMKLEAVMEKVRRLFGEPTPEVVTAASPQPAQTIPTTGEDEIEGLKIEELLGWSRTKEETRVSPPPEPKPEEAFLGAEEGRAIPSESHAVGLSLKPEMEMAEEETVVVPSSDLPSGGISAESPETQQVQDSEPEEATASVSPESMLVSGTLADLTGAPPDISREAEPVVQEKLAEATPFREEPSPAMLEATVSKMARDIIEKVAWEVVPTIAEALIKEELEKLKTDNPH